MILDEMIAHALALFNVLIRGDVYAAVGPIVGQVVSPAVGGWLVFAFAVAAGLGAVVAVVLEDVVGMAIAVYALSRALFIQRPWTVTQPALPRR